MEPVEDEAGLLYPELEAYFAKLPRLGLPIALTAGERGPARPYAMVEARVAAKLPEHVALDPATAA